MVESCSEVSDLMVELLCKGGCSDKECAESDGMDGGPWSHSKLMDCIRKGFKVAAVAIHRVDDEDNEHYEEITIGEVSEHGRWTQTVTKIEILRRKRT